MGIYELRPVKKKSKNLWESLEFNEAGIDYLLCSERNTYFGFSEIHLLKKYNRAPNIDQEWRCVRKLHEFLYN